MPVQFPAVIELSDLDGNNGYKINGISADDNSGVSVSSVGNFNGDGVVDLIIGAYDASPNGINAAGQSYVLFGGSEVGENGKIELSRLTGSDGFAINGIAAGDSSGLSVDLAGDINDDGLDDLIIGAYKADPNGEIDAGQAYVVFGGINVGNSGSLELSNLDGQNGFIINGIAAADYCGYSLAIAGDVNVDGISDIIIGAYNANPNGDESGQSYVIFGQSDVGNNGTFELSELNGLNGFRLNGVYAKDRSGRSVTGGKDVNADGVCDLLIGAPYADINGAQSGQSYVVFGGSSIGDGGKLELSDLNGTNGFKVSGIAELDYSGHSVSMLGDVNSDGIDDLLIGAYRSSPNGFESGQSYVVFGGSNVGKSGIFELSNLDGSNGFVVNGIAANDRSGISLAAVGDINHDGISDLLIGASDADPNGSDSGQSYLIFGSTGVGKSGTFELSSLNGVNGFILDGISISDYSGYSVGAAGDVNQDGVDDIIIGAYLADPNGRGSAGQSYVVFGDHVDLINNRLYINKGQAAKISLYYLNATSINHPDELLEFQISALQHGQFEFVANPTVPITTFYQRNITDKQVVFVHDGSNYIPSYDVSANTGMWASTVPEKVTVYFDVPMIINNEISINQGGTVILNSDNLSALKENVIDSHLQFRVDAISHGQFEDISAPGVVITNFNQERILDEKIQFVQDGSANPPSYSISVSDGVYTLPPEAASISFNYSPVLEANSLSIVRGKTVYITNKNLKASDKETASNELLFSISALKNGQFEFVSNPSVAIDEFKQSQIEAVNVQFVHDDSLHAPSYNVSVSDNLMTTPSKAALINWDPQTSSNTERVTQTKSNAGQTTLIAALSAAGFAGALLLFYISMGFLKNQRLKSAAKRGNEEQARFYQDVIIPIAKEIFKQIKVTGFMNYISANQMEAYVAEIATVVNEINQLGINIELQEMNPDHQTQLLNQIVKQMKRHLGIQSGMCNRAWFTSFFKPQIKPEMIAQKAKRIASSVHAALMGNPEEDLDEIELSKMGLLAGDERRDSMNSNADDAIQSQAVENARLQDLLEKSENNIQQRDAEIERLRELLNQQAADGSFNSTTSYVKLA